MDTLRFNVGNRKRSKAAQKKEKTFKALWVTSSNQHFDKMKAALEVFDVQDRLKKQRVQITLMDGSIKSIEKLGRTKQKIPIHTIVLMTYNTLIQKSSDRSLSQDRMDQVETWLGDAEEFDGMVSHSVHNLGLNPK